MRPIPSSQELPLQSPEHKPNFEMKNKARTVRIRPEDVQLHQWKPERSSKKTHADGAHTLPQPQTHIPLLRHHLGPTEQ